MQFFKSYTFCETYYVWSSHSTTAATIEGLKTSFLMKTNLQLRTYITLWGTLLKLKSNARLRREAVPNTTFCGGREFTHDFEFSLINSLSKKNTDTVLKNPSPGKFKHITIEYKKNAKLVYFVIFAFVLVAKARSPVKQQELLYIFLTCRPQFLSDFLSSQAKPKKSQVN